MENMTAEQQAAHAADIKAKHDASVARFAAMTDVDLLAPLMASAIIEHGDGWKTSHQEAVHKALERLALSGQIPLARAAALMRRTNNPSADRQTLEKDGVIKAKDHAPAALSVAIKVELDALRQA